MSLRDFAHSNFIENLETVDESNQNNEQFNLFSYDYFYVICCIFNELDVDEDGLIGRAEYELYSKHNVSVLALDRLFEGKVFPFKNPSDSPQMICYEDFIRLIIIEEDKSCAPAIEFWFSAMDLDCDGALT
jgi:hypothetical protein